MIYWIEYVIHTIMQNQCDNVQAIYEAHNNTFPDFNLKSPCVLPCLCCQSLYQTRKRKMRKLYCRDRDDDTNKDEEFLFYSIEAGESRYGLRVVTCPMGHSFSIHSNDLPNKLFKDFVG